MNSMFETRKITLPQGVLEVQMSEAFKERVRKQFCLSSSDEIDDDHVRMFFFGAVKTAVDKAEQEMSGGKAAG